MQTHTYNSIRTRELFLCTDGMFRALSGGYQLDLGGMNIQVSLFATAFLFLIVKEALVYLGGIIRSASFSSV